MAISSLRSVEMDHHETAAADIAGARIGHRHGKAGGDRGIDGVAAALQDVGADTRRELFLRDHQAVLGHDGMDGAGRRRRVEAAMLLLGGSGRDKGDSQRDCRQQFCAGAPSKGSSNFRRGFAVNSGSSRCYIGSNAAGKTPVRELIGDLAGYFFHGGHDFRGRRYLIRRNLSFRARPLLAGFSSPGRHSPISR